MNGQELYAMYLSEIGGRVQYWHQLASSDKLAWNRLADRLTADEAERSEDAWHSWQ